MALIRTHILAFVFGLLGNIVSLLVYLAPLPTFVTIMKKKSTQEFQSLPYSVALFCSMLFLYYGSMKTNWLFIIIINAIGCTVESIYLIIFLIYASRSSRIYTINLLVFFNIGVYGAIVTCVNMFSNGDKRVSIVGWICAVFSVCVSAAPLSVMRLVIKTKSVEFMSISMSFFLTLSAIIWFFYGLLIRDNYIAVSNMLQFLFGTAQMILYAMYKDANKPDYTPECKTQEFEPNDKKIVTLEELLLKEDNGPPMVTIVIVNDKSRF